MRLLLFGGRDPRGLDLVIKYAAIGLVAIHEVFQHRGIEEAMINAVNIYLNN